MATVKSIPREGNLTAAINEFTPDVILLEDCRTQDLPLVSQLDADFPDIPVIACPAELTPEFALQIIRAGATDILHEEGKDQLLATVTRALRRRSSLAKWNTAETRRNTQSLQRQVDVLTAIKEVGQLVTSLLDLDQVLSTAVEAVMRLTGAEDGTLMLLDHETGELYVRAARNFGDDFVKTFRLPVQDTLAGQVISSGEPLLYTADMPQKIKTAYMVKNLIYVPLRTRQGVIGVLGVDNQKSDAPFDQAHVTIAGAIADYAAIAIENARLYSQAEIDRRKLDTILTKVIDGVIVTDHDRRVVFINPTARFAFGVSRTEYPGKKIFEVIQHPELLQIFRLGTSHFPVRRELTLDDGRVFHAQATAIPEVGFAVTLQDITQIKELDRIKSEFVSTVSHDLRSPLTAILGYVELLDRVGQLNELQREFVHRVHMSVQNITTLINELLDLGRIEAGFDSQKEMLDPEAIINLAMEEAHESAGGKDQMIMVEVAHDLPRVFASPTRLQQIVTNLIGNAVKYTQPGGWVKVTARSESDQLILQIIDNGPGIALHEQPYIFDRFYRGSNTGETTGTGLGLAIVKSIVDNHQGRIWVDSAPGRGTTFTVVLSLNPLNTTEQTVDDGVVD